MKNVTTWNSSSVTSDLDHKLQNKSNLWGKRKFCVLVASQTSFTCSSGHMFFKYIEMRFDYQQHRYYFKKNTMYVFAFKFNTARPPFSSVGKCFWCKIIF